jgi:peptidyl-prolyl cis-trans isomerase C
LAGGSAARSTRAHSPIVARASAAAVALCVALAGCGRGRASPGEQVVARYDGGEVTAAELQRDANRLPPALRAQFESANGRREFVSAMIDKRLLWKEAKRRDLTEDPEVRRQVRDLEERLAIQTLLADEEKKLGAPTEAEAREYFERHRASFEQAERVRVVRILARLAPGASDRERGQARDRASAWAARLRRGEPAGRVAAEGDGPERARGGDFGFVVRGEGRDARLEGAAFALGAPGAVSPPVETAEGWAVVQLVERVPPRVPAFEEIRGEVMNRMSPDRKRRAYDGLLARLRKDAEIEIEIQPGPR